MTDQTNESGPGLIGGRYETVRAIGRGGMGTVWLATDTVLGRRVAAKQIGDFPGETAGETRRAMREARAAAALNHPNVVAVYDVTEHEGTPWLVMEYVAGPSLAGAVRERGPMTAKGAADLGAQLAGALSAAHRAGIVHRDVKPGNVLIGGGRPKLGDFGIARSGPEDHLTQTGLVTGTPNYMAPEVAEGRDYTEAADVWALGATVYYAVEGQDAYPSQGNPLATLRQIATQPPRRPERAGALGAVLADMLAHDPAARGTMDDAARRLGAIAAGRDAGASPAAAAVAPTQVSPRTRQAEPLPPSAPLSGGSRAPDRDDDRRKGAGLWWILLGALLAALVVGGIALALQGDDEPDGGPTTSEQPSSPTSTSSPESTPEQTTTEETTPEETTTEETTSEETTSEETTPEETTTEETTSEETTEDEGDFPQDEVSDFVSSHFSTVTEDPGTTWSSLTPDMQKAAGGKKAYTRFWDTIESVSVSDVEVGTSGTVDLTMRYTTKTGKTTVEPKTLTVVRQGQHLRIDSEAAR